MRKAYFPDIKRAGHPYWPMMWTPTSLEDALEYCEIDYCRPIFFRYFPKTGRILEGGCRLGQFVLYCQNQGYDIYGLDAVIKPLCLAKKHQPRAMFSAGDVRSLPIKSKTFKAYFSNGVAEHFEEGPIGVIKEAHRVLEDGGLFIITVPHINVKRRLEDLLHFSVKGKSSKTFMRPDGIEMVYKQERVPEKEKTLEDGYHFHTYYFTQREFARLLEQAGFRVLRSHGISIEWGLLEFSWLRALHHRLRLGPMAEKESPEGDGRPETPHILNFLHQKIARRWLKKFIVLEDPKNFLARPLLGLFRVLFGHLVLFVCEKAP